MIKGREFDEIIARRGHNSAAVEPGGSGTSIHRSEKRRRVLMLGLWVIRVIPAIAACPVRLESGH
jgi:hypothetical protein